MRAGLGSVKRTLIRTEAFSTDIFPSISTLNACVSSQNMTSCTVAVLARPLENSNRTDTVLDNFRSLLFYKQTALPMEYYESEDEMLQAYANNTVWAGEN